MDLKQVVLLALLVVPALTRCFNSTERLQDAVNKKLGTLPADTPGAPAHDSPKPPCPVDLYKTATDEVHNRSLSPWRYVWKPMDDHFPPSYITAQCLCEGCIRITKDNVSEDNNYNSYLLTQSRMFLKKVPCDDGKGHRLTPVYVDVGVGCTCVRPSTN